jgi:hypothetical protein
MGMSPPLQSITDKRPEGDRQGYWLALQALQLVLQRFPAAIPHHEAVSMNMNMKRSSPHIDKSKESARQVSARTQCSLQRIKAVFKIVANRKASSQRTRELWYAGCVR